MEDTGKVDFMAGDGSAGDSSFLDWFGGDGSGDSSSVGTFTDPNADQSSGAFVGPPLTIDVSQGPFVGPSIDFFGGGSDPEVQQALSDAGIDDAVLAQLIGEAGPDQMGTGYSVNYPDATTPDQQAALEAAGITPSILAGWASGGTDGSGGATSSKPAGSPGGSSGGGSNGGGGSAAKPSTGSTSMNLCAMLPFLPWCPTSATAAKPTTANAGNKSVTGGSAIFSPSLVLLLAAGALLVLRKK